MYTVTALRIRSMPLAVLLGLIAGFMAVEGEAAAPADPLTHWPLNWNYPNDVENHADLTWNGAPSYTSKGAVGGAVRLLNGTDGLGTHYLTAANTPQLDDFQDTAYTISAWIHPASTPPCPDSCSNNNDRYFIVGKSGWALGLSYLPNQRIRMQHPLEAETIFVDSTSTCPPNGDWCHVAGVYQWWQGRLKIYVNGVLEGETLFTSGAQTGQGAVSADQGPTPVRVGIQSTGSSWRRPFDGDIDHVRIYTRALSNSEVGDLYSEGPAWRPFSYDSPWNQKIPPNPTPHPNSAAMINQLEAAWQNQGNNVPGLKIDIHQWTIPLYWEDGSPWTSIWPRSGGEHWYRNGGTAMAPMPLPQGAQPDPSPEAHILVIDQAKQYEYACWDFMYTNDSSRDAGLCARTLLTGTGVRAPITYESYADPNDIWRLSLGPRACGMPTSAGLIRREEIDDGEIRHALVLAYSNIRHDRFVAPASTSQKAKRDAEGNLLTAAAGENGMPCGTRIQYDPTVNVDSLPISDAGKVIMKALQVYGAYIGDYADNVKLYANSQDDWTGVLGESDLSNSHIDRSRFRVMQWDGPLYDDPRWSDPPN